MIKADSKGGLTQKDQKDKAKARHADLVTLPTEIQGTNCENCLFVTPEFKEGKITVGFCNHPKLKMAVTSRMCCGFWDNKKTLRTWKR